MELNKYYSDFLLTKDGSVVSEHLIVIKLELLV